jgi:DNA polymerase III delta prime subunit
MCFKGDFAKAREISRNIQSNYKYNAQKLYNLLLNELKKLPLSTFAKIKLINLIADADFRAIEGYDGDIQISNLIAKICHLSEAL